MGEHRQIVVDHYPVDRLPDDLRRRLGDQAYVQLVINPDVVSPDEDRPPSWYFDKGRSLYTDEDPAVFVSRLRDEWE